MTVETGEIGETVERLWRDCGDYSLSDSLKARDASASKKDNDEIPLDTQTYLKLNII